MKMLKQKSMLIKVCGLRKSENIDELAKLPIDWMGFIFYPKSSRYVGSQDVLDEKLENALDVPQKKVGVFVDATIREIQSAINNYKLDLVQLHGNESPAFCRKIRDNKIQIIKAFRLNQNFDFEYTKAYEAVCDYFLFDTKGKLPGGTGLKFNWQILQKYDGKIPFILSGGIGPNDVEAIQDFRHPKWAGIDLNSGFEDEPALKNAPKLNTFIHAILQKNHDS